MEYIVEIKEDNALIVKFWNQNYNCTLRFSFVGVESCGSKEWNKLLDSMKNDTECKIGFEKWSASVRGNKILFAVSTDYDDIISKTEYPVNDMIPIVEAILEKSKILEQRKKDEENKAALEKSPPQRYYRLG